MWTFKENGAIETFDGDRQPNPTTPTTAEMGMGATFELVVAITHDDTGQYWALEDVTQTYKALEIEGLAVYEQSGIRNQHDTVLDTLQALTTEYASMGSTPMGFSQPTAQQATTLLMATTLVLRTCWSASRASTQQQDGTRFRAGAPSTTGASRRSSHSIL